MSNTYLSITSSTGRPENTHVRLSTGESLGHVQAVTYSLRVGEVSRCTVETIMDAAEVRALQSNTEVRVRLFENPLATLWAYYTGKVRRWLRPRRSPSPFDDSTLLEKYVRKAIQEDLRKSVRQAPLS